MDFLRRKDNNKSMLGPGLSLHNVYGYFLPKSVFLQTGLLMDSINKIALSPKYLDKIVQIPLWIQFRTGLTVANSNHIGEGLWSFVFSFAKYFTLLFHSKVEFL